MYIQSLSRSKRIPRSPPHGGHPGVSFPLFAPTRHRSFHHFTPPPYRFFNSNNLQSFAILFVYFCRAGNAKHPSPASQGKERVFYAGNRPGRAASQTNLPHGVKMSSRMPARCRRSRAPRRPPSGWYPLPHSVGHAVHREIEGTRHHIGDLGVG